MLRLQTTPRDNVSSLSFDFKSEDSLPPLRQEELSLSVKTYKSEEQGAFAMKSFESLHETQKLIDDLAKEQDTQYKQLEQLKSNGLVGIACE